MEQNGQWIPYVVKKKRNITTKRNASTGMLSLLREIVNGRRMLVRARKKIMQLRKEIQQLKSTKEDVRKFTNEMNPLAAELFKNELYNFGRPPKGRDYSPMIKDFALKQSFYSSSGYDQLRSTQPGDPGQPLPSRRSLRNYVFPVNCRPGHLINVIKTIGEDIRTKKHGKTCTLVMDEASLHKSQWWDPQLRTFIGRCTSVNNANDGEEDNNDFATQALVFMLVGIDGNGNTQ